MTKKIERFSKKFFLIGIDLQWFKTYLKRKISILKIFHPVPNFFLIFYHSLEFLNFKFWQLLAINLTNLVSMQSSLDVEKCVIVQNDRNTKLMKCVKKIESFSIKKLRKKLFFWPKIAKRPKNRKSLNFFWS